MSDFQVLLSGDLKEITKKRLFHMRNFFTWLSSFYLFFPKFFFSLIFVANDIIYFSKEKQHKNKNKTKQNKQNKTKQNKTKQKQNKTKTKTKTKQNKTKQNKTKQNKNYSIWLESMSWWNQFPVPLSKRQYAWLWGKSLHSNHFLIWRLKGFTTNWLFMISISFTVVEGSFLKGSKISSLFLVRSLSFTCFAGSWYKRTK